MPCGIGGWGGPLPGDPSNDITISAVSAFGGIDVNWTLPGVNPHAVAFVRIYRGANNTFANAIKITEIGGSFYYDKINAGATYYYWVQIVSVNGTANTPVGPASAIAKPLIADLIEELSGQLTDSELGSALKDKLDRITMTEVDLQNEIDSRLADNSAYQTLLDDVTADLTTGLAAVAQETINRTTATSAIAAELNSFASILTHPGTGLVATRATLANDYYTKVQVDTAVSASVLNLVSQSNLNTTLGNYVTSAALLSAHFTKTETNAAIAGAIATYDAQGGQGSTAIRDAVLAKVGYSVITATPTVPYDGDGTTLIYPAGTYPTVSYPEYGANRYRIIDQLGVTLWNATAAGILKPLTWISGLPLASAVRKLEVSDPGGGYAALEQAFTSQKTLNDTFKSQYTVKLDVNGRVSGFGLYNDGVGSAAIFNVDKFAIGQVGATTSYPFIVDSGTVYIKEAAISTLTFTKLRDEGGLVMVESGKIKADYISGRGLSITTSTGIPLLTVGASADATTFAGNVTGNLNGTSVATVVNNAATAASDAATALSTANTANTAIADIASDSKLTASEKQAIKAEWDSLVAEKSGINTQATTFSVTTENTTYNNTYLLLERYLTGTTSLTNAVGTVSAGSNMLSSLTTTSNLDKTYAALSNGDAFRKLVADFYANRQALLNRIAARAKELADAAQSAANTASTNATTALNRLNEIDNDNILTPSEKAVVIREYGTLTGEQSDLGSKLTAFGLTFRKTQYDAAISAVTTALTQISTNGPFAWDNTSGNTNLTGTHNVGGTGLRNLFRDAFIHRQWAINDLTNTAQTNANARLAASSRNVLSGAGGISVGGLDWWGDGTYKSGNGIGITSNGIVAYKAAAPTLVLGADGSAVFKGSLSVGSSPTPAGGALTTMTGSGALINPDGFPAGSFYLGNATTNITFNGTQITLNGEVVSTGSIAQNAISNGYSATTYATGSTTTNSSSPIYLLGDTVYSLPAGTKYMFMASGYVSGEGGNSLAAIGCVVNGGLIREMVTTVNGAGGKEAFAIVGSGELVAGGTLTHYLQLSNPTGSGNATAYSGVQYAFIIFKR
jgi:hypothetical protein